MKIAIDISSIIYNTGVSRYTKNLCRALLAEHSKADFILYGGAFRAYQKLKDEASSLGQAKQKIYPFPPTVQSLLFNDLHVSIERLTGEIDIFHSWDWYIPATRKARLVTTIHDLSALIYAKDTHPDIVRHHKKALSWIQKEARAIIAVSESTKSDIVNLLNIPAEKIVVIHEALPQEQQVNPSKEDINAAKAKFRITKPYFVLVGSQEKRKNTGRAIAAFKQMGDDYNLVLIGKKGNDTINEHKNVIQTGEVSSLELASLYRGSEGLIYPSLYEGFGLPILEAFYHQIPVVTSNISSMPEVAGEAASYCDPTSIDSIEGAIRTAIKTKKQLIAKGVSQLHKFSWEKTAKQTMEVYSNL